MDSGLFAGRKEGVFKRQLEARRLTASRRRAAAARRHKPRDVTMGDPAPRAKESPHALCGRRRGGSAASRVAGAGAAPSRSPKAAPASVGRSGSRASGDGSVENIARARGEVALDGLLACCVAKGLCRGLIYDSGAFSDCSHQFFSETAMGFFF